MPSNTPTPLMKKNPLDLANSLVDSIHNAATKKPFQKSPGKDLSDQEEGTTDSQTPPCPKCGHVAAPKMAKGKKF